MKSTVVTGDILALKSPADGKLLLVLATVTSDVVGFNVDPNVEVQESDGLFSEASYDILDDIEFKVVANIHHLQTTHTAEYLAILKHTEEPLPPLAMARAVFAISEPGVSTSAESVRNVIKNVIAEGKERVNIFTEKIEQFRRINPN